METLMKFIRSRTPEQIAVLERIVPVLEAFTRSATLKRRFAEELAVHAPPRFDIGGYPFSGYFHRHLTSLADVHAYQRQPLMERFSGEIGWMGLFGHLKVLKKSRFDFRSFPIGPDFRNECEEVNLGRNMTGFDLRREAGRGGYELARLSEQGRYLKDNDEALWDHDLYGLGASDGQKYPVFTRSGGKPAVFLRHLRDVVPEGSYVIVRKEKPRKIILFSDDSVN